MKPTAAQLAAEAAMKKAVQEIRKGKESDDKKYTLLLVLLNNAWNK